MNEVSRYASFKIWAVRIVMLAIAVLLLNWGSQLAHNRLVALRIDWSRYWLIQAVYVIAGIAFVVGVRFPFQWPRFAWRGLIIAGVLMIPPVHVWYAITVTSGPQFLRSFYWIDNVTWALWSVLAGVAVGASFGSRRAS
jgi:hypothetical protein